MKSSSCGFVFPLVLLSTLSIALGVSDACACTKKEAEEPASVASLSSDPPAKEILETIARLEELLGVEKFIPFAVNRTWRKSKDSISPVGLTQEAYVFILHHNPSYFKEAKFCPKTHKRAAFTELVNGVPVQIEVEMCSDYPVDSVTAVNQGNKESDIEFIEAVNRLYESVQLPIRYRRATAGEFIWFDTNGGVIQRKSTDPDLWLFATYADISDKDPTFDPNFILSSPSGGQQTYSVRTKQPTGIYEYRPEDGSLHRFEFWRNGGVWEWTSSLSSRNSKDRILVGGSWNSLAVCAASGYVLPSMPSSRSKVIGASRLVRTQTQ